MANARSSRGDETPVPPVSKIVWPVVCRLPNQAMTWSSRYISLILVALDAVMGWTIFNVIGQIRGVVEAGEWVILPLLPPLA